MSQRLEGMDMLQIIAWLVVGVISGCIATWIVMRENQREREREAAYQKDIQYAPSMGSEADPLPDEDDYDEDDDEKEGDDIREMLLAGGRFKYGTIIDRDIDLDGLETDGDVDLSGVTFEGVLSIKDARIKGKLCLVAVNVDGNFDCEGSEVGRLEAEGAVFHGESVFPTVAGETIIRRARFMGELILQNETFGACFDAENIRTDAGISAEGAKFKGLLFLKGAEIGETLDLDQAEILALDISEAEIDGDCLMRNTEVEDAFVYMGAVIHGDLQMEGNNIDPFPELEVKGELTL